MDNRYDVIIIGGGPAGLTAGIYAKRANLSVAILEYDAPGGKLVKTAEIANWPGIALTSGVDLAMQMFNHISSLGVEYLYGEVKKLEVVEEGFDITCNDDSVYKSKTVIIATGTKERLLNIPMEKEMYGRGVSYCAICDGAFFKDKDVVVVGGGNSALEEAMYLTQFANLVNVVIRRDKFRADPLVVDKLMANPKIKVTYSSIPVEVVVEDNKVVGLMIKSVENDNISIISANGVFPYIGADPSTSFLTDLNITNEHGYLLVNEKMETSIKGLYGAGDVCEKTLRQVVTAANDGAIAAISVSHYLED